MMSGNSNARISSNRDQVSVFVSFFMAAPFASNNKSIPGGVTVPNRAAWKAEQKRGVFSHNQWWRKLPPIRWRMIKKMSKPANPSSA